MFTPRGSNTNGTMPFHPTQNNMAALEEPLLQQQPSPHQTAITIHEQSDIPPLDLNGSPQPLEQRYALLDEQEAMSDASSDVIALTQEEKENLAHHIFRTLADDLKPLSGAEYAIVIPAILFALGACATSKDFGDKFVEGLATKTGVAWGIAAANVCAQFSLSTNSVMTVLSRLLHSRQRSNDSKQDPELAAANATAKKYDKPLSKKEKLFLATVPLSAFASYKMGHDTMTHKYEQGPIVSNGVGGLRFGSASLINLTFTRDQVYRWRGDQDLAVIDLLKSSKKYLIGLANNPLAFIAALNQNGLLKQLNAKNTNPAVNNTYHKRIEALVDELLAATPHNPQQTGSMPASSGCTKADYVQWISMILGGLVSLTNFKAGTKVPELFGLTVAKDLVDFFSNLAADWSLGIAALGFVFGIPSWAVNLIINARSCMNFAGGISSLVQDMRTNGTGALTKYWSADGALVGLLMLTSLGYGAGNGGSGYKYPPLNMEPIPIINLLLSTAVFTALGNLSQQGAVAKARDKIDNHLLERAINTENLVDFYQDLSMSEQKTLCRLLVANINLTFDSQISSYNKLQSGAVNGMFSEELQASLERRFNPPLTEIVVETPTDRSNILPSEPALNQIVVDPMLTQAQRSVLTSIRTDLMSDPITPPPPRIGAPSFSATPPLHPYTANNSSPIPPGMTNSPHLLFNRSPASSALNIPGQPRRHHGHSSHSHPHTHHPILGDDNRAGIDGFSGSLMAPTISPSPISPHSPALYSHSARNTPTNQDGALRRSSETTTQTHTSPSLVSRQQ
jgi:hypothetical protein